jgi:hypothetical protein
MLSQVDYSDGRILFLSGNIQPDYMRCTILIGLKELHGSNVIDVPKISHIYKTAVDTDRLYGRGFNYTQIVDDLEIDRTRIEDRIKQREFSLIIYGSIHRGTPLLSLIREYYHPNEVVCICGEDSHDCSYVDHGLSSTKRQNSTYLTRNLFVRELIYPANLIKYV